MGSTLITIVPCVKSTKDQTSQTQDWNPFKNANDISMDGVRDISMECSKPMETKNRLYIN
eukprot:12080002-Ditylum_brightwellii.AAC.1